jgi:hypothetical protein
MVTIDPRAVTGTLAAFLPVAALTKPEIVGVWPAATATLQLQTIPNNIALKKAGRWECIRPLISPECNKEASFLSGRQNRHSAGNRSMRAVF